MMKVFSPMAALAVLALGGSVRADEDEASLCQFEAYATTWSDVESRLEWNGDGGAADRSFVASWWILPSGRTAVLLFAHDQLVDLFYADGSVPSCFRTALIDLLVSAPEYCGISIGDERATLEARFAHTPPVHLAGGAGADLGRDSGDWIWSEVTWATSDEQPGVVAVIYTYRDSVALTRGVPECGSWDLPLSRWSRRK